MALSPVSISYDIGNDNLSLFQAYDPKATYHAGSGWLSSNTIDGIGNIRINVGIVDLPVKQNTRIDSIDVYWTENLKAAGFVNRDFAQGANFDQFGQHQGGISFGGQRVQSWQYQGGDFGVPVSFLVDFNGVASIVTSFLITAIVLNGTKDDTLPDKFPDTTPPPASGGCDVEVTYAEGTGPDCLVVGQKFTVTSEKLNNENVMQFTFSHPVNIEFSDQSNWIPGNIKRDVWLVIESPLDKITLEAHLAEFVQPTDLADLYLATRITIYCPDSSADVTVTLFLHDVYPGDQNTDVRGGFDAAGIIDAINKFNAKVHEDSQTLETILQGLPTDILNGLLQGTGLDVHTLAVSIATIIDGLAGFINDVANGNLTIPVEFLDGIKSFISKLAVNEGKDLFNWLGVFVPNFLKSFNDKADYIGNVLDSNAKAQDQVINNIFAGKYGNLDALYTDLRHAGVEIAGLQIVQNAFALIFGIANFLKSKQDIADIYVRRLMLAQYKPNIVDVQTAVRAYIHDLIQPDVFYSQLADLGYSKSQADLFIRATNANPSIDDVKLLYLRKEITQQQVYSYLSHMGLFGADADIVFKAFLRPPGPSDITRISDKHIFNNDIPVIFGQYSEIDQGYIDAMAQWGISEDWTRKLWAAHWSLPGLQDTFDMYHRGIITKTELDTFFKLTDILPFFRDRLINLNYSLITRVDIRRMYAVGVFNETDVYNAYLKIGYSSDDAHKLTQFTVLHEQQSEAPAKVKIRNLTEAMVVKAYKEGIITQNDAITRLGKVGFLADDAALILQLETQIANTGKLSDKTQEYHDKTLKLVLDSYINGVISENDVVTYLNQIGVPANQITSELNFAKIERVVKLKSIILKNVQQALENGLITQVDATNYMLSKGFTVNEVNVMIDEITVLEGLRNKPLTKADLEKLVKSNVIGRDDYAQELSNLGYSDKHVTWLVTELFGG